MMKFITDNNLNKNESQNQNEIQALIFFDVIRWGINSKTFFVYCKQLYFEAKNVIYK